MRFFVCFLFGLLFLFQNVLAQGQFFGLGINPHGSVNFYKLTWYPELQLDPLYLGLKNDFYFNENNQYFSKMNFHHLLYDHESFYVHINEHKDFSLAQGLLVNHYSSKPYGFDFLTQYLTVDSGVYLYPFSFNYFSNAKTFRVYQAELAAAVLNNEDNFHFQIYNLQNNQLAFNRLSSINGIGSDIKFSFFKFYGEYAQTTANIKSSKIGVALEHPDKFISVYADQSHYDQDFPIYKIDSFYENLIYRNAAQDLLVATNTELTALGVHLKPSDTFEFEVFSKQGGWSQWGASSLWAVNKNTFLELDYESGRLESYRKTAKFFIILEDSSQFSVNYELFFNPTLYEQTYLNVEYLIHF